MARDSHKASKKAEDSTRIGIQANKNCPSDSTVSAPPRPVVRVESSNRDLVLPQNGSDIELREKEDLRLSTSDPAELRRHGGSTGQCDTAQKPLAEGKCLSTSSEEEIKQCDSKARVANEESPSGDSKE
jgi:hypothetical protein